MEFAEVADNFMPHLANKKINTIGYTALAGGLLSLYGLYQPRFFFDSEHFFLTITFLSAAIAIITMTISVFWLWDPSRTAFFEKYLGPVGHILHCGYCMTLWLSAGVVGLLGLSFFKQLDVPRLIDFLLTWWSLGFLSVLLFEIIVVTWFAKLKSEFSIREHYRQKTHTDN